MTHLTGDDQSRRSSPGVSPPTGITTLPGVYVIPHPGVLSHGTARDFTWPARPAAAEVEHNGVVYSVRKHLPR